MLKLGTTVLLLGVFFALGAWAEERPIPELHKVLVVETVGLPDSDTIHLNVTLRDESGEDSIGFPSLVGPVFVSVPNAQLFSCESNSTVASNEARAFDLAGSQVFVFPHRGYLRDCGLTADRRLYWLIYSVVSKHEPTNVVAILDSTGNLVAEAEFPDSREFKFTVGGKTYSLSVPQAEMPG